MLKDPNLLFCQTNLKRFNKFEPSRVCTHGIPMVPLHELFASSTAKLTRSPHNQDVLASSHSTKALSSSSARRTSLQKLEVVEDGFKSHHVPAKYWTGFLVLPVHSIPCAKWFWFVLLVMIGSVVLGTQKVC